MIEALISFVILIIVICVVFAIVMWCVGKFFPEILQPARYVLGAIALIIILLALLRVVQGGLPGL